MLKIQEVNMINQQLKIHDLIEVEIKKLGINGEGIAYYNKLAVFIDNALPGEVILAKITEIFENRVLAVIDSIKVSSSDRLPVLYPGYDLCGAYSMQHVTYQKALELKRDVLVNAFNRYIDKKIVYAKIKPMIGMDEPLGYRNKVSLPVRKLDGKNRFGLYAKGGNEFIAVNDTPVHHPRINELIQSIEYLMDLYGFHAYIQKDKSGYMKSMVIRRSFTTGEIQVSFLLMKKFPNINDFVQNLTSNNPDIVSVFAFYTNNYKEQIFFTTDYEKLYGKATINEKINDQTFSLYPEAFFQLNTVMADKFYKKMNELANLSPNDIVIDAYAGSAPISHYIARDVKKVYAIEIDQRSVQSAILSLKRNNIKNVTVIQSDFKKALKQLEVGTIDAMFFDPPRTGLGYETIKQILKYQPKQIIYGSCNPSSLAKDLNDLLKTYDLVEVIPMDMFPYTPLVESVSLLKLKNT